MLRSQASSSRLNNKKKNPPSFQEGAENKKIRAGNLCGNNNKDKDNTPKTVNKKNFQILDIIMECLLESFLKRNIIMEGSLDIKTGSRVVSLLYWLGFYKLFKKTHEKNLLIFQLENRNKIGDNLNGNICSLFDLEITGWLQISILCSIFTLENRIHRTTKKIVSAIFFSITIFIYWPGLGG